MEILKVFFVYILPFSSELLTMTNIVKISVTPQFDRVDNGKYSRNWKFEEKIIIAFLCEFVRFARFDPTVNDEK